VLLDLLVGGEDPVAVGLTLQLLDHPILLVDVHVPIVNAADFQPLEVGLRETFPLLVHEAADVESWQHHLG
jgi:hypothetical protein